MNKTTYIISLAAMLLSCTAVNAVAKTSLSSRDAYTAANDTVDIDEEEFIASKDVTKLSKINRAQQEGNSMLTTISLRIVSCLLVILLQARAFGIIST